MKRKRLWIIALLIVPVVFGLISCEDASGNLSAMGDSQQKTIALYGKPVISFIKNSFSEPPQTYEGLSYIPSAEKVTPSNENLKLLFTDCPVELKTAAGSSFGDSEKTVNLKLNGTIDLSIKTEGSGEEEEVTISMSNDVTMDVSIAGEEPYSARIVFSSNEMSAELSENISIEINGTAYLFTEKDFADIGKLMNELTLVKPPESGSTP